MLEYIAFAAILIIIAILFTVGFKYQNIQTMEAIPEGTFSFPIFIINLDRHPDRYSYITKQLNAMGLTGYTRISGTDGFKIDSKEMEKIGVTSNLVDKGKGVAGCSSSHIRTWKHIAENKLGWSLILEDDAHFHPQFMKLFSKYWRQVPTNAKIIYPGFCSEHILSKQENSVISRDVFGAHAYLISWEGAQYLLDNLLPMNDVIDLAIKTHFRNHDGSYIFNGNMIFDGIRPNQYKESNEKSCVCDGIVYQNRQDYGTTVRREETVFE
jgi:GR25 family glycosyltransferase involved in LPS biosynthesis